MTRHNTANPGRFDKAAGGFNSGDFTALTAQRCHLTILDDINAQIISRPRIAPGNGVMPRGAATFLQKAAHHRIADRLVDIDRWHEFLDFGGPQNF